MASILWTRRRRRQNYHPDGGRGAVIHLYPTGQGNVVGHPMEPVIKLSGNPYTVARMNEHIDVDMSRLLSREITRTDAADQLQRCFVRRVNGPLTSTEALGHREFVMTKFHPSA